MNTTQLKTRLAEMTAEMSRYEERLAHLSAIEKARAQAIDERDVAQKDVAYWQARAERAEAEIVVLMENDACLDALNLLWQDIILAKNPDYGDWEYPGQAYRHIKAEFDDAEARVAELEAGQGWRDPNDQPESGPVQIILNAQMVDFFFYVPDANGRMLFKDSIVAWRPAPPQ